MTEMLREARNVSVSYGKAVAVSDVSLTLQRGEIVTIVGPNGAGKTTLLNALIGLQPSQGHAGRRLRRWNRNRNGARAPCWRRPALPARL